MDRQNSQMNSGKVPTMNSAVGALDVEAPMRQTLGRQKTNVRRRIAEEDEWHSLEPRSAVTDFHSKGSRGQWVRLPELATALAHR